MNHGMPSKAIASMCLCVLHQDHGDQVTVRFDAHLHHSAAQLFALPEEVATKNVDGFNPGPLALFKTEQQQIGPGHGRHIVFVEKTLFAPPKDVASHSVNRVKRLLCADYDGTHVGRLIETHGVIQFCGPGLSLTVVSAPTQAAND